MRNRSIPRYALTYLGQLLLTLVIINIFLWLFRTFAEDMITPAIAFPAMLVLLPPLMTGGVFRRFEDRRPGLGEILSFAVLATILAIVVLGALTWAVRTYAPVPVPEIPPELGSAQTLAAIAAAVFFAGNLLFFPLGGMMKQKPR